jgi:dolichol-phosphate mannosyltransferase
MKKIGITLKALLSKKARKQETLFILIGTATFILYISILFTLTESFQIFYIFSAVIAGVFSATLNFFLNKTITFHESIEKSLLTKFSKFVGIGILSWTIGLALLFSLTEFAGIYYLFSSVIATLMSGSINFIGNKFWNFKK